MTRFIFQAVSVGNYANPNRLIQSSEFWINSNPLMDWEDPISKSTEETTNSVVCTVIMKFCPIIFNYLSN